MTGNDSGLPDSWAKSTLGDVFSWQSGGTPKRTIAEYYGGQIPWAIIGDLNDSLVESTKTTITEEGLNSSTARWVRHGSVLLAMYGSIGKLGIAGTDLTTNQAIAFTQSEVIPNKWLFFFLLANRNELIALGKGDTQSNISQTVIKQFPFVLAPLAEQHRIVGEIERHLTRLDASVAALKRVQANLKRYRASVLKDACEGKLVSTEAELAHAEGRDYEPADRLLERILAERRTHWEAQEKRRGKYKEPVAPDTSNLAELPEGWEWTMVSQLIVEPLANGRSVKTADQGFPVLRLTALHEDEIDETEHKIGNWTAEQAAPFLIQKGDFFVSRGNGSIRLVGIGGLVREVKSSVAFPDTMIRFRLSEFVFKQYFSRLWNSSVVRTQVEASARTTAGIYKVNQQDLASMTIPLPPLAEQRRIVAEVERRLSIIQQAEAVVETNLARAERLRQSILKQAFEGKLVPQDPNDEPASVLLERIRAEREAAQAKAKLNRKPRRRGDKSRKRQPVSKGATA